MITCVSAELALPESGFSRASEILLAGDLLKSADTDGDAKRSFTVRLAPATFFID